MRSLLTHKRMAAIAMAACTVMTAAHAGSRTTIADADGWQPLGGGRTGTKSGAAQRSGTGEASSLMAAASSLASSSAEPSVSVTPISPSRPFDLIAGESVEAQLQEWAKRAGWTVLWKVSDAWVVPGNKTYGADFESAVKRVTEDLAANGADIVGDSWRDNHTIVITQNGAAEQ